MSMDLPVTFYKMSMGLHVTILLDVYGFTRDIFIRCLWTYLAALKHCVDQVVCVLPGSAVLGSMS
jgi:hypothetical protein